MKIGRIHITNQLLVKALGMPEDTVITSASSDAGVIELYVRHPDLKEIPGTAVAPLYSPYTHVTHTDESIWVWGEPQGNSPLPGSSAKGKSKPVATIDSPSAMQHNDTGRVF